MKKNLMRCMVLVAAAAVASSCGGRSNNVATEQVKTVAVKTNVAQIEEVPNTADFTSTIRGYTENNIAPNSPLRIQKILVEVGDRVSAGQLLATMDATNYNAANLQLAILESDFPRYESVYAAGGVSQSQMDQLRSQLDVQREQVATLKLNTELRSPVNGVVTARNFDAGDMYPGSGGLLQVMQIDRVKISASISEQYFPQVKLNMPADVTVDMYPDKVFEGKVSLIYPTVDAATRTFTVEITIPNPGYELRPGMFSRLRLNFGSAPGILVEDLAVQRQSGSNDKYVFIAKNGVAEKRLVQTGRQIGNKIHILSGINENEQVIVAGMSRLEDGTPITVEN